MADAVGEESAAEIRARGGEAIEEIAAHGRSFDFSFERAFGVAETVSAGEREIALFGAQELDRQHFAARAGKVDGEIGGGIVEEIGLHQQHRRRANAFPERPQTRFIGPRTAVREAFELEQTAIAMSRAGIGSDERCARSAKRDEAEAVALAQRKLDCAGGDRFRGVELREFGTRGVALRHRCARVDHEPDRQRTVAFGFAHEVAIRARIEFPVDAARFVAGLVRAVLREFESGAAAAADVLAETVAAGSGAREKTQILEPRADVRRNEGCARHQLGYATPRSSTATTSSALRRSASAANESRRRWRSTGAASATTSSRVAA